MKKLIVTTGMLWIGLLSLGMTSLFGTSAYATTYYTTPNGNGGYTTTDTIWGGQGL